ncbi:uncharacterized protein M421DRAFT_5604 [Didymella exigua CBS 183.55]|uniref:NACHT domain-containing protein n=1 Tax=Didymella exigua CBS 183.55 TaxID=1150837 RepID=A0A6A5RNM2_9PLEO|nr:uncharacterized protein M421DRAFT_5604 [Didymella exigua CBS 183.55]KAF1927936.1 hypothetical protein M421DRAFT_5604 [Didymella exigua CBS 183.55]
MMGAVLKEAVRTLKIVLFADGLDEFAGKPPKITDIMETMRLSGVKICASSRPWQIFEDAYGEFPHLRVQYLTYGDIKHYATSRLQDGNGYRELERLQPGFCTSLIKDIGEKSSGIFIWVVLVTQSLLEGLTAGEGSAMLNMRFDDLPRDLEDLFWKIL